MSKERFDHLLSMVRDRITKNNTHLRESITAEEVAVGQVPQKSRDLRDGDRELQYRYLRVSKETFNYLLSMVRDRITKNNTHIRESITAEEVAVGRVSQKSIKS